MQILGVVTHLLTLKSILNLKLGDKYISMVTIKEQLAQTTETEEKETGRIEAFSDGVFSIAITLLVLDMKVPHPADVEQGSLISELLKQWPVYLAFFASFFFILVLWINHHRLFTAIRRSDNNLMLLNGLLLLGVILVPFPTSLVSQYLLQRDQMTAILIYNGLFFLISLVFNFLWWYASYRNRLFSAKTDRQLVRFITRQYAFGPPLYLITFILAFFNPMASLLLSIIMAIFFALPNKAVQQLTDASDSSGSEESSSN